MKSFMFVLSAVALICSAAGAEAEEDSQTGNGPLLKVTEEGLKAFTAYLPVATSIPNIKTDRAAVAREGLETLIGLAKSGDEDIEKDLKEFLQRGNKITEVTQQANKPGQHTMMYTIRKVIVDKKHGELTIGGATLKVIVDTSKDEGPSYKTQLILLRALAQPNE